MIYVTLYLQNFNILRAGLKDIIATSMTTGGTTYTALEQAVFYKIELSKGPKKKCCKSYKKKKGNMCKRCPKKFCIN